MGTGDDRGAEARRRMLADLVRLRKQRGITQAAIARELGTTQSSISDLETGETEPRLSTLQDYSRILGCQLGLQVTQGPLERLAAWRGRAVSYLEVAPAVAGNSFVDAEQAWSVASAPAAAGGTGWTARFSPAVPATAEPDDGGDGYLLALTRLVA